MNIALDVQLGCGRLLKAGFLFVLRLNGLLLVDTASTGVLSRTAMHSQYSCTILDLVHPHGAALASLVLISDIVSG